MARFASLNDAFMALADIDPSAVDDARDIVAGITGHRGIDDPSALSLADMLRWLWLRLPSQPGLDPQSRAAVVAHASSFFGVLGRPMWSIHCCSSTTAKVHAAWDRSPDHGMKAFRRAFTGSGVEPPDVEGFEWSTYFGPDEQRACDFLELLLEMAIDSGHIQPGRRGWKQEAERVTRTVLFSEAEGQFGQRWIDLIVTERLGQWVESGGGSALLSRLRGAVVNHLLHPIPVPDDMAVSLRPLLWFCERLGETGVKLSARGYLDGAFVQAAAEELGWKLPGRAVRSEVDLHQMPVLRELAFECGFVDLEGGRVVNTSAGIAASDDPAGAWHRLVAFFGNRRTFDGAALHALLLGILADEGHTSWRGLGAQAADALAEAGWMSARTGRPTDEDDVLWATSEGRHRLELLGALDYGDPFAGAIRLTPVGRSLALAILRVRAVGPRRDLTV